MRWGSAELVEDGKVLEHPALTLYHSGIVVDDLDQAMATWSAAFDLHWAPPRLSTSPLRCPAGILGRKVRLTYSIEGPQHIELLEQVEDAPYRTVVGGQYIHHLGYRTADLVGQVRRLEDLGFLCVFTR
jgi:Glyoxalase/Bleomycin resistance protein/Dioxygenase superfamily